MERFRIIDTHTGGEPTRVVISGPIVFESQNMRERREEFRRRFDDYRRAIVCEPRGSDVMVGALLTPPEQETSLAGVIFFNNIGYLGMCGHGTLGVAAALHFLETVGVGIHRLDTPVGTVEFEWTDAGQIRLQNVASYRYRAHVPVDLPSGQRVHGDIAWGGNWFFICADHGLQVEYSNLRKLEAFCLDLRQCMPAQGVSGEAGAEIDHVELLGAPSHPAFADSKNFVLCPGAAYDRSPCGTGTSAKLACLAADGLLVPGQEYRQQGIVGSVFVASYQQLEGGRIQPTIAGTAHVNGEGELLLDPKDPFCMGLGL